MGIYDRDYYRNTLPRAGFGHFVAWSVTTWLIVINVAVFFADAVLHRAQQPTPEVSIDDSGQFVHQRVSEPPLTTWGEFSFNTAVRHLQVWRFITYQFLHANPWHLIFNMLGLYFFGPIVEAHFGSRRYLAFYLLCGLAGAGSFVLLDVAHVLNLGPDSQLVGASAGIFGLLVASAMIAPYVTVFYYLIPVTVVMLAVGGMLLAIYTVLATGNTPGENAAGGEAAHLGGALGFLLMKNQHWLDIFAPTSRRQAAIPRPRRQMRAGQKDWSKDLNR